MYRAAAMQHAAALLAPAPAPADPGSVVYLSSLPSEATEAHVKGVLAREGQDVVRVELLKKGPPFRRQSSGLAVVQLVPAPGAAARCCAALDGKPLLGRPLIARPDRFVEDDHAYDPAVARAAAEAAEAAAAAAEAAAAAAAAEAAAAMEKNEDGGLSD